MNSKKKIVSKSKNTKPKKLTAKVANPQTGLPSDGPELRQVEKALRISEDRYRLLVDNANEAILVAQNGMLKFVNRVAGDLTGYSEKELTSIPFPNFIHPDDRDMVVKHHLSQLERDIIQPKYAFRLNTIDGSTKWVEINAVLIDWEGKPATLNFLSDITERKQAEEVLRESQKLHEKTFASLLDAVFILDNDTTEIKDCNPAASAIFGYSRQEMLSRTTEFLHVDQASLEEFRKHLNADVKEKGFLFLPEFRMKRKDGTVFHSEHSVVPLENEQGKRIGWVSVVRDITERKRVEEALRESEEKFKTLFNSANDAIFTMNHTTFLDCNSTTEKIFRCSKDQIVGHSPVDFSPEQQPDGSFSSKSAVEKIESAFAGEPQFFEWLHTHLDGTPFYVEVSLNRVFIGGEVILQAIVRDITERKQAEEALHQSEVELRALFASMHDVVLVIDRDGVYRKIAPTNPGLLVKPPEELLGKTLRDVFQPEQVATFISAVQQVLDTKQTAQIEYDLIIGDQTVRFETYISPMTEDSTLWMAHDITRRKRFELVQNAIFRITKAAITSEGMDALYHSIHSILGELIPTENFYIALYDPVTELISFPYYVDQYDESPSGPTQIQGLTGYVLCTGRPLLATREVFDRLVGQGEIEAVGTVGVDWMGAPLKAEGRMIGVMAVQSYTEGIHFDQEDLNLLEFVSTQVAQAIERKRLEEEIRNLSLTDELTGLYNRRGFTLLAKQEVKLAHRIKRSMLLFFTDVDDLKVINDTHGHAQGDLALKEVSAILKETFREADIPARIGGDEFVVLAVDASMESAELLTNRIQANLERRNQQGDRAYQMSLSMGIARYDPEAPCTLSKLIAQADALMYQQKHDRK